MLYKLWTTLYFSILYYFFPYIFVIIEAFVIGSIIVEKNKEELSNY